MPNPFVSENEDQRLEALRALGILDTPVEERFDRIIRIAQRHFRVPMAAIALVDANRQWFKACVGLPFKETSRDVSFCSHTIRGDQPLIITDTTLDPRFAENPLVTGETNIRFYAGQPLSDRRGNKLGTLCIMDHRPRKLTRTQVEGLKDLAGLAEWELSNLAMETHFHHLVDQAPDIISVLEPEGTIRYQSPSVERILGYKAEERQGQSTFENVHPDDAPRLKEALAKALGQPEASMAFDCRVRHADGSWRYLEGIGRSLMNDPSVAGLIVNLRDVTQRREAEQQVERLKKLERFLAPQVAQMVLLSDNHALLESHRSEIATVFCDLRGFTRFGETAEPEVVMRVLGQFHEAVGAEISRFEGTLAYFAGDGLMVFFNDPLPCPDPAMHAVKMALAMRERVGELQASWQAHGFDLGFGTGISLGFATLGTMGFSERVDYTAIGSVVNHAARLCEEANPGQILLTQRAYTAVADLVDAEPAGTFVLKGVEIPMPVFNVTALRDP